MLTVSELRDRIAGDYPDVSQVSDTAVRFARVADAKTYAIYYIDITQKLPDTMDALTRYQDRTIGQHYFEGPRSLQWSNYLFFLQPPAALRKKETIEAKHLIEADRAYARKFVLDENALEAILAPPSIETPNVGSQLTVMTTWAAKLTQPGLLEAVFDEDLDIPKRVALITRADGERPPPDLTTALPARASEPLPFISHFEIKKFRPFPKPPSYDFGLVNLIVGPNAVGKTSLMEAIELFYCGRTKRDPEKRPRYSFDAIMSDGSREHANNQRNAQFFRHRNLHWYGQPEIRTNDLYWSFSLFNFLNTDAAVGIGESTKTLSENLASLLVGPEASKVWDNILRLSGELETRVRETSGTVAEQQRDHDRIAAQLEAEARLAKESDTIKAKLDAMMRKLKWTPPTAEDDEERAASLASALSEYASLAEQAADLAWAPAPVTVQGLSTYCIDRAKALDAADAVLKQWKALTTERAKREAELKDLKKALELAREARLLIEAEIPRRSIEATRHRETAAQLAAILAGAESIEAQALAGLLEATLKTALKQTAAARETARVALQTNQRRLSDFTALREKSVSLGQQLRSIAEEILGSTARPDECPLCHTQFAEGELAVHIHSGLDAELEATGQALILQVRNDDAALGAARALNEQMELLIAFARRAGVPQDATVSATLKLLAERRRRLEDTTTALQRLDTELRELETRNLSQTRFQRVLDQLARLGHPLETHTFEGVAKHEADLSKAIAGCEREITRLATEMERVQGELNKHIGPDVANVDDAAAIIGRDRQRVTAVRALLAKLAHFAQRFQWPARSPLVELVVNCRSMRSVAAELQTALQREAQQARAHSATVAHRDDLAKRLARGKILLERLDGARQTLSDLKETNSLTTAMEATLEENRGVIENIFGRIHAPKEFKELGKSFDTLIRDDGEKAKLSEISTGQRAAFALSIFLARNSQLVSAPRVILIDDPIAHVDDFNALSFLDYLRDLVITGSRQIFFATANDKIAALFERKFDFMGEEYRRFNLSRETA